MPPDPKRGRLLVALAGQQNAGKSTIFNALTGLQQHIANYPGVTVDKKSGRYTDAQGPVEAVDLPGTYSLTSFSLEERVARAFLVDEHPDVVVHVVDASHLRRGLTLTFQLMEMGFPVVVALNMMDVARAHGLDVDASALSRRLGAPVVPMVGRKGRGIAELKDTIRQAAAAPPPGIRVDAGSLEAVAHDLTARLADDPRLTTRVAPRWLAGRLLEDDEEAARLVREQGRSDLVRDARQAGRDWSARADLSVADHLVATRVRLADSLIQAAVRRRGGHRVPLSERIDRVVLNRWLAPFFLVLTVWTIYQVSIVQGYELTHYTWPILAEGRRIVAGLVPDAGFLVDPMTRSLTLWLTDSAITLLNYVPIFLILFALIAMVEDSGYMARIAFILDRILHRFGLHGQSTLPYVLAGVFAGGCAVPGVMATKGIPDHRARLATVLTVPYMNCLAKVPFYTLLIGIYFAEQAGLVMFYLSTFTIIAALLIAKLLSVSVLRGQETAPFVMELPHYHRPTVTGVLRRSVDRTWLYIKKVGTIVVAIAVVVYVLLHYPGLSDERRAAYQARADAAVAEFHQALTGNPLAAAVAAPGALTGLVNVYTDYKAAKLAAGGAAASKAVDAAFQAEHPDFWPLIARSRDPDARAAHRALRDLTNTRKTLRREMRHERIVNSLLGRVGRGLEPVTQFAGFDWRINVALLSSFAARESSVATLGALFEGDETGSAARPLAERMGEAQKAAGHTALGAVAIMLFFALYPPCLATIIMVRVQTGSTRWMIFSLVFPTVLGLSVASATFTAGRTLGLTGIEAMSAVYGLALGLLILVGLYRPPFGRTLAPPPPIEERP